jgi:hypothetical protein
LSNGFSHAELSMRARVLVPSLKSYCSRVTSASKPCVFERIAVSMSINARSTSSSGSLGSRNRPSRSEIGSSARAALVVTSSTAVAQRT